MLKGRVLTKLHRDRCRMCRRFVVFQWQLIASQFVFDVFKIAIHSEEKHCIECFQCAVQMFWCVSGRVFARLPRRFLSVDSSQIQSIRCAAIVHQHLKPGVSSPLQSSQNTRIECDWSCQRFCCVDVVSHQRILCVPFTCRLQSCRRTWYIVNSFFYAINKRQCELLHHFCRRRI